MVPNEHIRKKQLGILWEITILVVAVFLVYGLLTYAVFTASGNRLIDKSIDKLKQTEAENISSSFSYVVELVSVPVVNKSAQYAAEDVIAAFASKQVTGFQKDVNVELEKMVNTGLLGIPLNMLILEKSAIMPESTVVFSSDESLIYQWDLPDYIDTAINEDQPYVWMEEGLPELGLDEECLAVIKQVDPAKLEIVKQTGANSYGLNVAFVGIKPMHDEITAINDFYSQDKKTTNLILLVLVLVSILIIALITFAILSYLIRTRITRPIQELSSAAEQVMEGDLDVHITIRAGEEFESLKRAFQSMVDEWGKLMTRSIEQAGTPQQ